MLHRFFLFYNWVFPVNRNIFDPVPCKSVTNCSFFLCIGLACQISQTVLWIPLFLLYYCFKTHQHQPAFGYFIHSNNIYQALWQESLKNCSHLLTYPPTVTLNLPNYFLYSSLRLRLPKVLRTKNNMLTSATRCGLYIFPAPFWTIFFLSLYTSITTMFSQILYVAKYSCPLVFEKVICSSWNTFPSPFLNS